MLVGGRASRVAGRQPGGRAGRVVAWRLGRPPRAPGGYVRRDLSRPVPPGPPWSGGAVRALGMPQDDRCPFGLGGTREPMSCRAGCCDERLAVFGRPARGKDLEVPPFTPLLPTYLPVVPFTNKPYCDVCCQLTTPHKLRPEARSRKRTGRRAQAHGMPKTDGRGRQLHAVVRPHSEDLTACSHTPQLPHLADLAYLK